MDRTKEWNVGTYLLYRLQEVGIKEIFGVPGDFNLGFLDQVLQSDIKLITTCNELNAGYAADGYGRVKGAGSLVTTYGVGGLSAINAVAGSFVERVPIVVISGSPSVKHYEDSPLLHHTLGDYAAQLRMYREITTEAAVIMNPEEAPAQIDRLIKKCIINKKPVYIELPKDIITKPCKAPGKLDFSPTEEERESVHNAIKDAAKFLENCEDTAILAGIEVYRYKLHHKLRKLVSKTNYPFATMLLDKSIISEQVPQYIGMYQGALSPEYVKNKIENASALLCLGTLMTDANLGWYTAKLDKNKMILATNNEVHIGNQHYPNVPLREFLKGLIETISDKPALKEELIPARETYYSCETSPYNANKDEKLTMKRFFERMSCYLEAKDTIICDIGSFLFSATEMVLPDDVIFLGQSFYCSIGYSMGASLGAAIADRSRRVIVFVGDGAFQMTAQEISSLIRYNLNAIVFLINNDGYTVERLIHDGPYNDIQQWQYHNIVDIFGGGKGYEIKTESDLESILPEIRQSETLSLVNVHLGKMDTSESLKNMLEALR